MLLFDAYHKDERGGTGEVFDWSSLDEFEAGAVTAGVCVLVAVVSTGDVGVVAIA